MTWRSPIAATRSFPLSLAILLFEIADRFGKSPLLDVDRIVARREDAAAADLLAGPLDVALVLEPLQQLVHQPRGDDAALARVDEAEIEERNQQHFPIELHVRKELAPVDLLVALQ